MRSHLRSASSIELGEVASAAFDDAPTLSPLPEPELHMTGTPAQIEWAETIKLNVAAEFARVEAALSGVASTQVNSGQVNSGQADSARADIEAVIAILRNKRNEVLADTRAGYFIREWQELNDQVRRMLAQDPGYQALQVRRKERRG